MGENISLLHHMIDTGIMGKMLLQQGALQPILIKLQQLIPGHVINTVTCLVALHDLGKCHPYFQGIDTTNEYICRLHNEGKLSFNPHPYRHEIGSKYILECILKDQGLPPKVLRAFGTVLRPHHQKGTQQQYENQIPDNMNQPFWVAQQKTLFDTVCSIFHPDFSFLRIVKI